MLTAYESPSIIAKVGSLLRKPFPRSTEDIEVAVMDLEDIKYDLAEAVTDHMRLLYEKRKQMLWPKDAEKNLTELDRTVRLSGDVAVIERDYQLLCKIEQLVNDRIAIILALARISPQQM